MGLKEDPCGVKRNPLILSGHPGAAAQQSGRPPPRPAQPTGKARQKQNGAGVTPRRLLMIRALTQYLRTIGS